MRNQALSGMKEIQEFCKEIRLQWSERRILEMHEEDGFPMRKLGGSWESDRGAIQLMDASKVIDNVHNCEQIPQTESQARPLVSLPSDQQREAWQEAVETAPEGKVTAAHVYNIAKGTPIKSSVAKEKMAMARKKKTDVEKIDPAFQVAWDLLYEAIKAMRAIKWATMSKADAIKKVSVLIDVLEI